MILMVLVGATAEESKISQLIPFQQSAWWMRSNNRLCGS
ncbi:ATPase, AAA family domain protein [Neisseria lactamica ATCC 23970]|nr:ATPase, AAA family domain protein [Neisseria lactamica ATCC 23970]